MIRQRRVVCQRLLASALICSIAAACGCGLFPPEPQAESGIDRQTFIEVYVALRSADMHSMEAAEFEARKADIMAEHGVTPEQLLEFVERHGHDVRFMADVWKDVQARMSASPAEQVH